MSIGVIEELIAYLCLVYVLCFACTVCDVIYYVRGEA